MSYKPAPFQLTDTALADLAVITEKIGKLSAGVTKNAPSLHRANRIRTIQGSLAIEQNTLTLEQVTAVLDGKRVLAPPREIAEVKNAYEIYEHLHLLNPYSTDDLLSAHGVMMRGLVHDAGEFRTRPVGVVDADGNILHVGTLPQYVPSLVADLLDWVRDSTLPMPVRSCIFHYEFELIHPFSDGNGRTGRLWHTLLLSTRNPAFAWLPIESVINDRVADYYAAFNASNAAADATEFLAFMLSAIKTALLEAGGAADA